MDLKEPKEETGNAHPCVALAVAVNNGREVHLSKTTIDEKERERRLKKKKHFPWMDLVNEALDVLHEEKLRVYNLKPTLLTTNNQRVIGKDGVCGHMREVCDNDESMSNVHKSRFGNGIAAFQCRHLKNKGVIVHNGFIDKGRKISTTYPIYCACCFGVKTKRWCVEDFVLQEIGRITVQLCKVHVNCRHMGDHVGVTLEELSPHNGSCYLRTKGLSTIPLSVDDKQEYGKGFSMMRGSFDIEKIVGKCDDWSRKITEVVCNGEENGRVVGKEVDSNTHLRLWLFLVQNWPDVGEWTDLEWSHSWPIKEQNAVSHLTLDRPSFVQPCKMTTTCEGSQKVGWYLVDSKLDSNGNSVSCNEVLRNKAKPGTALFPLNDDVFIVFKHGRYRAFTLGTSSNWCDEEVTIARGDGLLWQGDTEHRWGDENDNDLAVAVRCRWRSSLHVESKAPDVSNEPADKEKFEASMESMHEFFFEFYEKAKEILLHDDPNPQMDLRKKNKIYECYESLCKLVEPKKRGKRKRTN